jgi:hypothetical protein
MAGCSSTALRAASVLTPQPQLSSETLAKQGEVVERPLAPDPLRFDLSPATLAVLTNEVATDMNWQEHFVHQKRTKEAIPS